MCERDCVCVCVCMIDLQYRCRYTHQGSLTNARLSISVGAMMKPKPPQPTQPPRPPQPPNLYGAAPAQYQGYMNNSGYGVGGDAWIADAQYQQQQQQQQQQQLAAQRQQLLAAQRQQLLAAQQHLLLSAHQQYQASFFGCYPSRHCTNCNVLNHNVMLGPMSQCLNCGWGLW